MGTDGHVWDLGLDTGVPVPEDISGFTNSPLAGGDPFAD